MSVIQLLDHEAVTDLIRGNSESKLINFWRTKVDRLHNYFDKHLKCEESQMNAWSALEAGGHSAAQKVPYQPWNTQGYYRFRLLVILLTIKFGI